MKRKAIVLDDSAVSSSVKTNRIMDFVAKILCLIAAFLLWFYAMSTNVVTVEKDFTVPVAFEKESELYSQTGWSVLSGKDSNVVITLKGKRSIIKNLDEDDLYAYVDLSTVESVGRQNLQIRLNVPTECEVINQSVSELVSYVDKKLSRNVPIEVIYSDYTVSSQYHLDDPILSINEVSVVGPESELSNVKAARAVLKLGNVTQTMNAMGVLRLIDKNGNEINSSYLTLSTTSVGVTVKLFTEKEVPLSVSYKYGYFNDSTADVVISPKTVKLRGEPSVLDKIETLNIATLDEKQFATDMKQSVPIVLPEGVLMVGAENEAVIDVKHKNTATRKLSVNNIILANADPSKFFVQTPSLNIDIRGSHEAVTSISSEDVSVLVDMDNYKTGEGVMVIPVTIQFSSEFSGNVYELGSYTVKIQAK